MEFKQLIITDITELTDVQAAFVNLHMSIVSHSQMAASHLVLMARELKQMRDEKMYIAAGFESFGEYTEAACNIKERQAYNYIQILEKLPEDFLQSTAKIGITKLQLLAGLSEGERIEICGDDPAAIEDKTVSDLKAQIEKLREDVEVKQRQFSVFANDIASLKDAAERAMVIAEKEKASAAKAVADLTSFKSDKKRIESELKAAKEALEAAKKQHAIALSAVETVTVKDLESDQAYKELKVDYEAVEEQLASAENKIRAKEEQVIQLEKQLALSDTSISKFTAYFETFQSVVGSLVELLDVMPANRKESCTAAIKRVMEDVGL